MKDFEAIKELWKVQDETPINFNTIIKNISANRNNYARKLIIQTIAVFITLAVIVSIWLFKPFATWTTHLSMFILCFCLSYFLIIQYRDYKKVCQFDHHLLKPQDFIDYLKQYKKDSYLLNIRNYKTYAIGVSLAFVLILFEIYFILSFWVLVLFTVGALIWFLLSYLYLIKAYIKTENNRVETMISQLEKLKDQLKD